MNQFRSYAPVSLAVCDLSRIPKNVGINDRLQEYSFGGFFFDNEPTI
jgi:hypothetical protein